MASGRVRWAGIIIGTLFFIVFLVYLFKPESAIKVTINTVQPGLVQKTVANTRAGTLSACRRAGISPSTGGQIAKLPVKEGERVKSGQILMELWNKDRVAQVKLATKDVLAAQARKKQACITAEVSENEAGRVRKLHSQGLTSEDITESAEGKARANRAACDAAKALEEVSKAKLDVARSLLERTQLLAPFDGIVAEINGEVGEFVTPSPVGIPTPPAVDLVDTSCLYVSAPIDEVDAPVIKINMPAIIALDAYKDKLFNGRVRRIAPYVLDKEKQARTVNVEVEFDESIDSKSMLPGYSADIEIILAEKKHTLRIPSEALMENNTVYTLNADNIIESRKVETGISNWAWTEITSGLIENDRVVVSIGRKGVAVGVKGIIESNN
jgi:HlyD family secretion protein